LDFYIDGLKDKTRAEDFLKNRPLKFHKKYYIKLRRAWIHFVHGEWYHPEKSIKQELKAYPAEFEPRFKYCLSIKLNKILFGPCIYDEKLFKGISLSPYAQKQLDNFRSNKQKYSSNFKPLQLNRLLLEEAYPKEIKKGDYANHLWNIVKNRYILADKQAQYFEIITTQFFILGILSMRDGPSFSYGLILLIAIFISPVLIKDRVFDWFKNKNFRFIVALLFFLALYWVDANNISMADANSISTVANLMNNSTSS
jgi:hypothetical protein